MAELDGRVSPTAASTSALRGDADHNVSAPTGKRREDAIVGASEATRRLIAQVTAAARTEMPQPRR